MRRAAPAVTRSCRAPIACAHHPERHHLRPAAAASRSSSGCCSREDDRASAAWLLGVLGATDWVDGYVARHLNQVSELGKVLDPIADRLLFIVCVGGILIDGSVPTWFGVAVLAREVVVGGTLAHAHAASG